jgi:hypothetical protein
MQIIGMRLYCLRLSVEIKKKGLEEMSNSGGPQHVCFYSNKCRWSAAFINEIKETPFKGEFKYICVDPAANGQRPPLPGWLKKVPTLVIRGEDEPRTDGDVMNWLAEKKLLTRGGAVNGGSSGGPGGPGGPAEPEPWVGTEMGGSYTKGFSFIADDQAPIGNFEFLNGQNAPGTRTASEMPNGGAGARGQPQTSKKQQLFDKQMEEYMRQRGSGMPAPVVRQ